MLAGSNAGQQGAGHRGNSLIDIDGCTILEVVGVFNCGTCALRKRKKAVIHRLAKEVAINLKKPRVSLVLFSNIVDALCSKASHFIS
jgi:hypothetical protein